MSNHQEYKEIFDKEIVQQSKHLFLIVVVEDILSR